jgi:tetratricopeptide (TPR) repeat protein
VSKPKPKPSDERVSLVLICLLLAILVLAVFGKTRNHRFVNFDDDVYVYNNPSISSGLTARGIVWAFSHVHSSNWHPLTTLSHMLDCTLYGLNPTGHHLTNVFLHGVTAILLLLALLEMTGELLPSAFVAALFAIHPLRVESVAWISERKDILSGLFFVLSLWAYGKYTRKPPALKRYSIVLLLFAFGLLCKPMLVSFPFVLLLLDYWPLRRLDPISSPERQKAVRRLVLEKLPLFAVSIASCLVTLFAQQSAMDRISNLSLLLRVENAISSYAIYLWQTSVPRHLAALYPFPEAGIPWWQIAISLLILVAISWVAFAKWRTQPWLLVGWFWYLGMLVPVIGITQVGLQARADRYLYLPQIGLWLMIVWSAADLVRRRVVPRWLAFSTACAAVVCFSSLAWSQTGYWRDSETLWRHALSCTSENVRAHGLLALALTDEHKPEEAIAEYRKALQIKPGYADALNNIGNCLVSLGRLTEAMDSYEQAVKSKPDLAVAHDNLAELLSTSGRIEEAAEHYRRALELQPGFAVVNIHWGKALARLGRWDEAIDQFRRALKINPAYAAAYYYCGAALAQQHKLGEAVTNYLEALRFYPQFGEAQLALGASLAAQEKMDEAILHYEEGNRIFGYKKPDALIILADAYASVNRIAEAISISRRALDAAASLGEVGFADAIRQRIAQYSRSNTPSNRQPPN